MLGVQVTHKHLEKVGLKPIESANSLFWHDGLKLLLMVYVDDFRMAGPEGSMKEGWKLTRSDLDMDDPVAPDRALGCYHTVYDSTVDGKPVRCLEYDMREFMKSCIDNYLNLTNKTESS